MFPILPILILLLLGPANAERLAVEGRLPAALLAVHRTMVPTVCATVVAPVEEEAAATSAPRRDSVLRIVHAIEYAGVGSPTAVFAPGWPSRAGPKAA